MASSSKRTVVAPDPHWLRLIQQVPAGTPGAIVDPVFGRSWLASAKSGPSQGLNGRGGWLQADLSPILGDTSEFTVTLPPVGSDGRSHRKRLYFYADTPDPQNLGQRTGYVPGDEWIEVYRGASKLLASGTPVSEQGAATQLQITCRDVLQPLKKAQETAAGFWCHSPRDVFEFYTRADRVTIAEDFSDPSQWPTEPSLALTVTPNGEWEHVGASQSPLSSSFVRITAMSDGGETPHYGGRLTSRIAVPDEISPSHGRWRVETQIAAVNAGGPFITLTVQQLDGTGAVELTVAPAWGSVLAYTVTDTGVKNWTVNAAGLLNASGQIAAPLTLAIEGRERWVYFYLNGQLIACGIQPYVADATGLYAGVGLGAGGTGSMDVDYLVARETTVPLNGGDPGDYRLASDPAPGGLWGEYYDLTAYGTRLQPAPPSDLPVGTRVDAGVAFENPPTWMPDGISAAFTRYVRWSGAIYLPLAAQDIHFSLPAGINAANRFVLRVGRTRDGEAVSAVGGADTGVIETAGDSSTGMRSLLGSVSGWYPIVLEYWWSVAADTNDTVEFFYDLGGEWSVPTADVLSPEGVMRGQITGSHYDTLRTLSEQFVIEWVSEPRPVGDDAFPGVIVPRVRVNVDTDKVITDSEVTDPQTTTSAEDLATTTTGQAQGLGGAAAGTLTAEAFNFAALRSHPFVSTETENLPGTSDPNMLALQLETLLALRSEAWQDLQLNASGSRQKQTKLDESTLIPLSGELAEFDWQPGMGARVKLDQVEVDDIRRILQARRIVYPDGVGGLQVSFKQRPRDFRRMLQRFIRQVLTERRTFQGQLSYVSGNVALDGAIAQVPLPPDLRQVRQAWLIVVSKSDDSEWDVTVNGAATGQTARGLGRIDVSQQIAKNNGTEPQMTAQLTGGTGDVAYQLLLLVLIPKA